MPNGPEFDATAGDGAISGGKSGNSDGNAIRADKFDEVLPTPPKLETTPVGDTKTQPTEQTPPVEKGEAKPEGGETKIELTKVDDNPGSASAEQQLAFTDQAVNNPRTPDFLAKHGNSDNPDLQSLVADLRDGLDFWQNDPKHGTGIAGSAAYQEKNSIGAAIS